MIIHIEICDVCKRLHLGLPLERLSSGDVSWDVGECCRHEKFGPVTGIAASRAALRARVVGLITSELAILRGSP